MSALDNEHQQRESIEHLAELAATKAVRETMLLIGVDMSDPIKAQSEFAALRTMATSSTQGDLAFLRRLHNASDTVKDTSWRTIIRVLVAAGLGLVAIVSKDFWLSHIWK